MSSKKLVTVVRAGLAGEIKHIRTERGLTLDFVCGRLKWEQSKVSRMERGQQCISQADLASLLVIYDVTGQERQRLLRRTERQDDPGYWEHDTPETVESRTLLRLESDALAIVDVEPVLIPELAQTAEYACALLRSQDVPAEQAELRVQARIVRQTVLAKNRPPKFSMILAEQVLRWVVGDRAVMASQLRALLKIAERPNVRLWMVPFDKGGNAGMDRRFRRMDFPHDEQVVFLGQGVSAIFLDDTRQTDFFRRRTSQLVSIALDPKESVHLVATIMKEYQ